MPTVKLRSANSATTNIVAVICATPPIIAKPAKRAFRTGISRSPVPINASANNTASGAAKTKRANVAPPVLSRVAFRCFCSMKRRFCANAAAILIGIQSSIAALMPRAIRCV